MAGNAVAVRDGKDVVNGATGEVVGAVEVFEMKDYLGTLDDKSIKNQQALSAAYDRACADLIGPNDVQEERGRTFKKKSAWRKLARYFRISTEIVGVERDFVGENFIATVTVKALGPWGQSAEAVGACATDEATGRRTITIADAVATAETRATNRAISNLIAMGEVSAEEMSKSSGPPRANKPAAEKVMPIGKSKGKKLGAMTNDELNGFMKWRTENAADKFGDLADAIGEVLADRAGAATSSTAEESHHSPGNTGDLGDVGGDDFDDDSDLPF